jgi:hypothetical protein
VEEETHLEAVEAVEAAVAVEAEELRLLRSLRPRPRQLFPKRPTSELWGHPQEYLKETEPKRRISLTNCGTTTASTEEWLDSILL